MCWCFGLLWWGGLTIRVVCCRVIALRSRLVWLFYILNIWITCARTLFVVNGDRLVRYIFALYNITFIRTWNVFIVLELNEEKHKPTINQVGFPANTICQNLNFSYVIMASTMGASIILKTIYIYGSAYQINCVCFWNTRKQNAHT